jgi:hypothetical protein
MIDTIADEEEATWDLDVCGSPATVDGILELCDRIADAYTVSPTDVLVTKTLLAPSPRCTR